MLRREPVVDRNDRHAQSLAQISMRHVLRTRAPEHHRPAMEMEVETRGLVAHAEHPAGDTAEHFVATCRRIAVHGIDRAALQGQPLARVTRHRIPDEGAELGGQRRRHVAGLGSKALVLIRPKRHVMLLPPIGCADRRAPAGSRSRSRTSARRTSGLSLVQRRDSALDVLDSVRSLVPAEWDS
jgi:hypothetical protein